MCLLVGVEVAPRHARKGHGQGENSCRLQEMCWLGTLMSPLEVGIVCGEAG